MQARIGHPERRTDLVPGKGQVFLGAGGDAPQRPKPQQLAHIYRLSDPGLAELPLERLLDELLDRAVEILEVDTAAILLYDEAADELLARAAKGLEEEVERGVRIPVGNGFAGRIAAGRVPVYIADVDHADVVNPLLREKGVKSMLGVPLVAEGDLLGVLHVGSLTPRVFSNDDAVVLQLAAGRAAPAIERARLFEQLEVHRDAAVRLQRSLLPGGIPVLAGVEFEVRYLPARDEVGGDWYDVLHIDSGSVGIAIGDVAGQGVRAAALMAELRAGMRAYALDGHGPAAVLQRVHRLLQVVPGRGMATAAYVDLQLETGRVRYAVAGHPPPLVVDARGEPRLLDATPSPPLGALPFVDYEERQARLLDGETLLLYTDGLVESRGERLREGLARLLGAAGGARSAGELCEQLTERLAPPGEGADDVAMVAVHNEPVGAELDVDLPARPESLADLRRVLRRWLRSVGAGASDISVVTLAVGEACANAVEHAYPPSPATYGVHCSERDGVVSISVTDAGRWREPRGENRGRGLTIIESAMDSFEVRPREQGTEIVMSRRLREAP